MSTISVEVKDFTGGRNFVTSPFNLFPTESVVFENISLDNTGMRTRNFVQGAQLLLPTSGTDPIQVSPRVGEAYDLTTSVNSYTEKVRFYQGNRYIISGGVPYMLGASDTKYTTTVINTMSATAPQTAYTPTGTKDVNYRVEQYTYYLSYRSAAGFESALTKIDTVNGLIQWDTSFTTETPSTQTIVVASAPAAGAYGRVYRMGGNISHPSLVFQFSSTWAVSLTSGSVTSSSGTFTFAMLDDALGIRATTWGAVYPTDLRYLTATKYGLAAAKGSQIYLSMNKPDAWSELSSLNFGSEITGIASVYRGFVVFTESAYMYLITGSTIANLQVNLVSTDVGCTSNSAIAEVGQHALIWTYNRRFYIFNGSSVQELEPNTYDWDYFYLNGYDKDLTAVSVHNKYLIGSDKGIAMIDLNHRYKPFLDYTLDTRFTDTLPCYMREITHNNIKAIGAYASDDSFYALDIQTYGDVSYVDNYPPTDNWAMGVYAGAVELEVDGTTCIELGHYGAIPMCALPGDTNCYTVEPSGCTDYGSVGIYPFFASPPIPVKHMSDYTSPMFTFGNMNGQCTFSSVEVMYEGELTIFAYIDSKEIVFKSNYIASTPQTARLVLPNKQARGSFLQVRLRFNGAVFGYRVNGEPLYQFSK